jgi:hypothetical protein
MYFQQGFEALRCAKLYINAKKTKLLCKEVDFL